MSRTTYRYPRCAFDSVRKDLTRTFVGSEVIGATVVSGGSGERRQTVAGVGAARRKTAKEVSDEMLVVP